MLQKDDAEHPIPPTLRSTFREIADALAAGDFQLQQHTISGVRPVSPDTAKWIEDSVSAYGERLAPLSDATWERSVYLWMDSYWQAIVDLTTAEEPVSDLALHAKLYENEGDIEVELYGVYVPWNLVDFRRSPSHPLRTFSECLQSTQIGTAAHLPGARNRPFSGSKKVQTAPEGALGRHQKVARCRGRVCGSGSH